MEPLLELLGWISARTLDLVAILAGLLVWAYASRLRRAAGLPAMDSREIRSALFGGATVALLAMLCIASLDDRLLELLVAQERFLLFFVAIFAAIDEWASLKSLWTGARQPLAE